MSGWKSMRAVAAAALMMMTMWLAGCSLLPDAAKDETVGWSAEKLYTEGHNAMLEGNYTRAVKLFEWFVEHPALLAAVRANERDPEQLFVASIRAFLDGVTPT